MNEKKIVTIHQDSVMDNKTENSPDSDTNGISDAEMDPEIKSVALEFFNPVIERFTQEELFPLKNLVSIFERAVLIKVLSRFNGNQKKAADYLGLKLTTLSEKIKKHGILFRKEPY